MARSRTRTRNRRRGRRYGRRRNYRARAVMPFRVKRVLKTTVYYQHDAGAGTISVAKAYINSANDPAGAIGSGQPLGHDQYSGLYERCAVIGGKIFVECVSSDATTPIAVGVNVQPAGTDLTTYEHYREMPHTSFKLMTPDMDKVTLSLPFGVSKFFGHRKLLTDDRLSAAIGSDPADLLYAHFFCQAVDKTANPGAVHMVITITQTIIYFKPKTVARS